VDGLTASVEKMRRAGIADSAVDAFRHYYTRLVEGDPGMLPESELEPVEELPDVEALPVDGGLASEAIGQTLVLKLNGGLGTTMGMTRAKSLLEAKDGLTFLDVIARQVLSLRRSYGVALPLVLMNSFHTREDSLAALARYPDLALDIPLDFVQNRVPKLRANDLQPVSWDADPELEWAPPGHGDLYTALSGSGMLQTLLDRGYRYAFVSNSDNLGAVLDTRILAWMAREQIPFLMEACDRTQADRKGGHIALRADGLVLRESAQTPEQDMDSFLDVRRHRFFNTNNLWVDLRALARLLAERGGVLGLPMIVNRKTVDSSDPSSPEVIQLETAMGSALGVFEGARALHVPRRRFAPVKTTADLLVVRSDAYVLTAEVLVEPAPERRDGTPPIVELDPRFYKLLRDFESRFAGGSPSLLTCDRLTVEGDVMFGRDVTVRGAVTIRQEGEAPLRVADGTTLEG
jgi:UTP--glucose-1-phosphate uridylyltransferase